MKWYLDKEYVKKHLVGYIQFQLNQGYLLKDIKKALLKYGYDHELIDDICKNIDLNNFKPKKQKQNVSELNEDLYIYLQNLLIDYIRKEQEQGYTIDVIKRALINYGHNPSMVNKAIKSVRDGTISEFHQNIKLPAELLLCFCLAVVFGLIFFLGMATDTALFTIVLSFLPCIVAIFISYAIVINSSNKNLIRLSSLINVILMVILFVVSLQTSAVIRNLSEPGTILLLNIVIGFFSSFIISIFSKSKPKKIKVQKGSSQEEITVIEKEETLNNSPKENLEKILKYNHEEKNDNHSSHEKHHINNKKHTKRLKIKDF